MKFEVKRVAGVVEILGSDGSWAPYVVVSYTPEGEGYAFQLTSGERGWVPLSHVRGFVSANGRLR